MKTPHWLAAAAATAAAAVSLGTMANLRGQSSPEAAPPAPTPPNQRLGFLAPSTPPAIPSTVLDDAMLAALVDEALVLQKEDRAADEGARRTDFARALQTAAARHGVAPAALETARVRFLQAVERPAAAQPATKPTTTPTAQPAAQPTAAWENLFRAALLAGDPLRAARAAQTAAQAAQGSAARAAWLRAGDAFHAADSPGPAAACHAEALKLSGQPNLSPAHWTEAAHSLAESRWLLGLRTPDPAAANKEFAAAAALFRQILETPGAPGPPRRQALLRGNLGAALAAQGLRVPDPAAARQFFVEAATAFRAAAAATDRAADPVGWSRAQANLARACADAAARARDATAADALWAEAIDAHRAAAEALPPEKFPAEAAAARSALALALQTRGLRGEGPPAAQWLGQAAENYALAAALGDRAARPVEWAVLQTNVAFSRLEQARRAAPAEAPGLCALAAEAAQAAQEALPRDRHPAEWAAARFTQGLALTELGRRTPTQAAARQLMDAAIAFRDIAKIHPKPAAPVNWAHAQWRLGDALAELGRRAKPKDSRWLLEAARAAYAHALEVFTAKESPQQRTACQSAIESINQLLAAKPGG